ncbi:MAG: beta-ketoacyl-ACP synthase II, partial [Sulfurimonadaceae bacterium]|nr:beta-ketoacyl-ACP synthase II [Sulfurimonadaceae bacterium]
MINALGHDKDSFDAIAEGQCGVAPITLCPTDDLTTTIAAEVKGFDPLGVLKKKELKKVDRFIQLGLHAAQEAFEDAALDGVDCSGFGVVGGNGMGGIASVETAIDKKHESGLRHTTPFLIPSFLSNMLAGHVSMRFGMHGPNLSVTTACAAGTHAIIEAYKTLQFGSYECMMVVGAESTITSIALAGFGTMNALSKRNDDPAAASRPFDRDRDGFVMGEGAGALVLETLEHAQKRGATIYAELTGFGESADAYHITTPHAEGLGAKKAMREAWEMASKPDLGYINAHGTGTRYNDLYEAAAINELFGTAPYVSSTKGQIGHTLGAAGAIESVISIMAMQRGCIPPVINYEAGEDEMASINLVANEAVKTEIETVLSCNFGFGGTNAAVIFEAFKD